MPTKDPAVGIYRYVRASPMASRAPGPVDYRGPEVEMSFLVEDRALLGRSAMSRREIPLARDRARERKRGSRQITIIFIFAQ